MKKRIFPPSYLNLLIILEILVHWLLPIYQLIPIPYNYSGIVLIGLSLVLNIYSVRYLEHQNTSSNFFENSTNLVISGPFSRSRNPIYLSGVGFSLGVAIFLGSLTPFIIPLIILLALNNIYIPDEEIRLEENFGREYRAYKSKVRRWI